MPDLIQSLNSGRLLVRHTGSDAKDLLMSRYQQCEMMTANYKTSILLIEFVEQKAFFLQVLVSPLCHTSLIVFICSKTRSEMGSKQTTKSTNEISEEERDKLQSQIVLLTLSFPRLKVIWSSSSHQTADIFRDLKSNEPEPDIFTAKNIGLISNMGSMESWNQSGQDCLRSLPGISARNIAHLMSQVKSLERLVCEAEKNLQSILGNEAASNLYRFISKDATI
jgi:DNA excision repair protein ERCC-4